ncbi:hypothetical protein FNF27_04850 [Cafeteria roenbergensis]|uniref:EF-hand domain-containing protein n=1 Tax=Cafeteria roenbergensis TaxID=33653 RepID=A0A5A8ECQ3_CAFRO|nr:hypothetical protein FNF29_05326 [Cafeteria roenbergensis]KAA0166923.1 hypothetical protein FNF28_02995 [Cafeteria roenbergensis]KAA0173700.1 hypothetical protein FNF27_04850 [Cafeteria roenbergensis]|eukprot:KAA0150314.1 hypothetical protein FNF29_05326 [Cafeteria roenbergensis]
MASGFDRRSPSPSSARAAAAEIGAGWARPSAKRGHGQLDDRDPTPAKKPRDEQRPSEEVSGSLRSHFREQRSLGVSLRKLFHAMDEDHTGHLSMDQFGAALRRSGMNLTHSDLQTLEGALATREGLISYERLLAFIESDAPPADEAHSRARLFRRRRAAIAKLSAASLLSDRQVTAAKMVAFDTHPLVREAVRAFGASGDESELLARIRSAAVAISGDE